MYKKWKSVSALSLAALLGCLMPMGTMMAAEENTEAVQENTAAPVINITWNNGESCTYSLGGTIDYKYVKNTDQAFECSASQDEQTVSLYYYLDKVEDINAGAKETDQMASLSWVSYSDRILLSENARYVLYVKAVGADEQTTYACSCGVVVDNIKPEIVGLVEGNTYPEGTTFKVEDVNLASVKVNETDVTPESDGSYRVRANGTSCMIRATDKAGNENTCSITVTPENPEENNVISANGTYSLKSGTPYQLAEGKWQVSGDSTVYQGGSTFYVTTDKDYSFTKR